MSPRHHRTALALLVILAAALGISLGAGATSARADAPMRLQEQITDRVGALGERRGEVDEALRRLREQTRLQLFVVFVRSFDGVPARDWADQTAVRSDLGDRDGLLAVAVGDRAYAYTVDQDFPLTDAQLSEVAAVAIEPALAANDWAGAVIGAADGYRAVLAGEAVREPTIVRGDPDAAGAGGGTGFGAGGVIAALCVFVALAAIALGVWLARSRTRPAAPASGTKDPNDAHPGVSTQELNDRANLRLIELDDALRTSERELSMARDRFGVEATASFEATLTKARDEVGEAFRLRMLLEDDPSTDAGHGEIERRRTLAGVLRHCDDADARLDAEADAFDALREIESRIEPLLAELGERHRYTQSRLAQGEDHLQRLRSTYVGAALTAVDGNPDQVRQRLAFAVQALDQAGTALSTGTRPAAALAIRGAEQAIDQASAMLDAIARVGADLDAARDGLPGLLAELETDLAAARAAQGSPSTPVAVNAALAGAVTGAEQVARQTRAGLAAPTLDPLEAARVLQDSDAALDQALANARDAALRVERARVMLEQALRAAQAEISAAADFIDTRRGAVRAQARTLLAEAQRLHGHATAIAETDPVTALAESQQADRLAEQASRSAQSDVDDWRSPGGFAGPNAPGGFAGPSAPGGLGGFAGAVLGGILVGGARRGHVGGRIGGGGGFGGGRSPGGFGGSGRRGGGGRF